MYESFYGFREKPFSLLPDPGFLYLGKEHGAALSMLKYGLMNQAGFTVITGEIGSGKTTLIRQLLREVDRNTTVGLISNTSRSIDDLLQSILLAFNLEYRPAGRVELYRLLHRFFLNELQQWRRAVLIVDEAQNMSVEALEEIRVLSNVNADKHSFVQLVLVGQPQLRDLLQRRDMVQLTQRVVADYHLRPLNGEETRRYIQHRVRTAGGRQDVFEDGAYGIVFEYTGGIPRLINVLCDTALVCGYAEQSPTIGEQLVHMVAQEKALGGILPLRGRKEAADGVHESRRAPFAVEEEVIPALQQIAPMTDDDLKMLFRNKK